MVDSDARLGPRLILQDQVQRAFSPSRTDDIHVVQTQGLPLGHWKALELSHAAHSAERREKNSQFFRVWVDLVPSGLSHDACKRNRALRVGRTSFQRSRACARRERT